MATEKQELAPGTVLVGRYKKVQYSATVCEDGIYVEPGPMTPATPEDPHGPFKTLSAAGKAVMGGIQCNGWRFWTPANGGNTCDPAFRLHKGVKPAAAEPENDPNEPDPWDAMAPTTNSPSPRTKQASAPRPRMARQIRKVANQKSTPLGKVRWFCSACMAGFLQEVGTVPFTCPNGHPAVVEDEFATVSE